MPLTRLTHTTRSGRPLFAVPSLASLQSLAPASLAVLTDDLGIRTLSDLLHYAPIHDAQLLTALSNGEIAHDFDFLPLLQPLSPGATLRRDELGLLPVASLRKLAAAHADAWKDKLQIATVGALARFAPFEEAQAFLDDDPFREAPSAPRELIPQAIGSVSNVARFTSFVRDSVFDLSGTGLKLFVDEARVAFLDPRLLNLFQIDRQPKIQLGYSAQYKQSWINLGTALGEPVKSIGLAPGEVRKIAVLDWQRRTSGSRAEDTRAQEQLQNQLIHNRALDEVTRATATEHQQGGSSIDAGTLATAMGGVASGAIAGAAAIGIPAALVGAAVGTAVEPGGGTAAGAIIGLAAGGIAGGIGGAALAAQNQQWGVVESDTSGSREVATELAQRINDVTNQKASSVRSLWSTVILTEQQAERAQVETIVVANYNHAHALTIQYFEVLQHYQANISLTAHQPLLYLPFKPILFDLDLVVAYWSTLRRGIGDAAMRNRLDEVISDFDAARQRELPPEDQWNSLRIARVAVASHPSRPLSLVRLMSNSASVRDLPFSGANPWVLEPGADDRPAIGAVRGVTAIDPLFNAATAVTMGVQPPTIEIQIDVVDADGRSWAVQLSRALPVGGSIEFDVRARIAALRDDQQESSALGQLDALVKRINERRYYFTRLLLLGMEQEQLTDLVDALMFGSASAGTVVDSSSGGRSGGGAGGVNLRSPLLSSLPGTNFANRPNPFRGVIFGLARSQALPLSALVEPTPIAITGDTLVFRMKRVEPRSTSSGTPVSGFLVADLHAEIGSKFRELVPLRDYPLTLATALAAKQARANDDIFLPTGGVFAEAILGRAISAERLDGSRNIFWHELPIPHAPAEIQPVGLTLSQQSGQPLQPTVPDATLTPATPTPLPEPSIAAGTLAALGNGNLFRDMSKTDVLAGVLGNLSALAGSMANQAGSLAGAAQQQALREASALAGQVAGLTSQLLSQQLATQGTGPVTSTQKGVTQNTLQDLAQNPPPSAPLGPNARAIARAQGGDLPPAAGAGALPFIGGPQPASIPQRADGGPSAGGGGGDEQRLSQGPAPSLSPISVRDRFDGISNPGQTAKAIIRDALDNAARSGEGVPDLSNLLVEWFDLGLRPALQGARSDDAKAEDALRELFDFLATADVVASEQSSLPGSELGRRVAEAFRLGAQVMTHAVDKSNLRLAATGDLRELQRIDRMLATAQADDRFGGTDNLGLGADLANLKARAEFVSHSISTTVASGQLADVAIVAGFRIDGGPVRFDPPLSVSLSSFEIEEPAPTGLTSAADGSFRTQVRMLAHDPTRRDLVRSRGNDLRLAVTVVSTASALLSATVTLEARGAYDVRVLGGLLDTDPLDAPLRASPVVAPNQTVLITFAVAKGPAFAQREAVAFSVVGAGTLDRSTSTTDLNGEVQVAYTAPGSGGVTATVRADVSDGTVTGRASIDVRVQ